MLNYLFSRAYFNIYDNNNPRNIKTSEYYVGAFGTMFLPYFAEMRKKIYPSTFTKRLSFENDLINIFGVVYNNTVKIFDIFINYELFYKWYTYFSKFGFTSSQILKIVHSQKSREIISYIKKRSENIHDNQIIGFVGVLISLKIVQKLYSFYNYIKSDKLKQAAPEDSIKKYIDVRHNKFKNSFFDNNKNFSVNIEKVFYNAKELKEALSYENNPIEKIWKSRIMIDYTPRGNIIMYYDAYKNGFAYYSDQNVVSYPILNAAAMKYVLNHSCRDFYMDENYLPSDKLTPLIKVFYKSEEKQKDKETPKDETTNQDKLQSNNKNIKQINIKDGPFAKLKNYRLDDSNILKPIQQNKNKNFSYTFTNIILYIKYKVFSLFYYKKNTQDGNKLQQKMQEQNSQEQKPVEKMINKFIYLGKTHNFNILQKVNTIDVSLSNRPTKYDGLFGSNITRQNSDSVIKIPKPVIQKTSGSAVTRNPNSFISWRDYKQKLNDGSNMI